MEDQYCNRFDSELYKKTMELEKTRQRQDEERLREMEKRPRCALLPSPDILATAALQGEDVTDTLRDYEEVLSWLTKSEVLNTGFYQPQDLQVVNGKRKLSQPRYGAMVQLAFDHAFAPILHTGDLGCPELVVWYYAGHGLGKVNIQKVEKLNGVSAVPRLEEVGLNVESHNLAATLLPERSTDVVKGGELCLHHVGFCDLYGILRAWIAALTGKSQNIRELEPHVKKNKHLVLILDSCYSGTFANDLNALAQSKGPWNTNGCTVTVQASCSADEPTFGGYFTPLFLHLNQNPEYLKTFCEEWEKMTEEKTSFSGLPYPSPVVATTRNEGNDNFIKEIKSQEFPMVLFPDAGFFKYCFVKCFEKQNMCLRILEPALVSAFLSQSSFTVLDYKLKKLSPHAPQYANTPLGLFLVDAPDTDHVVCVHIHFPLDDTRTSEVRRINLVHHLRPRLGTAIYEEERPAPRYEISTGTPKAKKLVTACHDAVEKQENGRWSDHSQWNMTSMGVKGLFRLQKHPEQRSQDMNKYLQTLDIYDKDTTS